MKDKILRLKKRNRSKGWRMPDMIKALGLTSPTYYNIMKKPGYIKNSLDIDIKAKLEVRLNELLRDS